MAKSGEPQNRRFRPRVWRWLLPLPAVIAIAMVEFWAANDLESFHAVNQMTTLASADLEARLAALVRDTETGLGEVVQSLGDDRIEVRATALRVLHHELDRWSRLPARESVEPFDGLARMLAIHTPHFRGESLQSAAALAERLMLLSPDGEPHGTRLRNCHVVLAAQANQLMKGARRAEASGGDLSSTTLHASRRPDTRQFFPPGAETNFGLEPLAGGGLPLEPSSPPARLAEHVVNEAKPLHVGVQRATGVEPSSFARTAETGAPATDARTAWVDESADVDDRLRTVAERARTNRGGDQHLPEAEQPSTNSVSRNSRAELPNAAGLPEEVARLLELDRRLRAADEVTAAAARKDQERLGIDESQLALARGAVDPDPQVRTELAEALPSTGAVNGRRWLLWLSQDSDAEVRRAALSLLATSGDLEAKKLLSRAVDSDGDARIRAQARKAIESAAKDR